MIYNLMNCHIVDKNQDFYDDVLIKNNKIKLVGRKKVEQYLYEYKQKYHLPGFHPRDNEEVIKIDIDNNLLMPSFADLHFHLRNPGQEYKETLESGNRAALKGGYTHLVTMANTRPPIDTKAMVEDLQKKNNRLGLCTVFQASAVTMGLGGEETVDFESIRPSTRFFSDDGKNVDSADIMRKALIHSIEFGFIILDHSEEETEMVKRNIDLAVETGGRIHFCHVSKAASLEAIMKAKDAGHSNITVEVAPHHIYGANLSYKVHPPFATEEDRQFLIQGIKEGYVDAIATDHAPHTAEDKEKGAPGLSGIETALAMVHKVFIKNNISMQTASQLMSYNPGKMMGLEDKIIREGGNADLTVIQEGRFKIQVEDFVSLGKNNPFDGDIVHAKVLKTFKEGKLLYSI